VHPANPLQALSPVATVSKVLVALAELGTDSDRAALAELDDRLMHGRLRVLVAGEAKRGKSTVINALLGRSVLPTGVTPVTALATTIRYGTDERVEFATAGHASEHSDLEALADLVTERGNPCNKRGLRGVTVYLDAPLLAQGVEFVDTPGTGSVYTHNTAEAERTLKTMDAAVFVLTADPPIAAAERELLQRVAQGSLTTFVLLNKADRLDNVELREALEFTADQVAQAAGHRLRVRPVSARRALNDGQDAEFTTFATDFERYLATKRARDLHESVVRHARRIADRLLDEVRLTRRTGQMRSGKAAHRVALFRERLAAVSVHQRDSADLARAESGRLLQALNEAAERDAARFTARTQADVAEALASLAGASPAEMERRGREILVRQAREAVESWRDQQRKQLEAGLAALDSRLTATLAAELAQIRDAAAELLDLDLTVPESDARLVDDPRFFFSFAENAGQTELLAGAVRRRLPGEFGRRRAREHVLRECGELIPRQVGRSRADLQYRLTETTRALVRALDRRYADSVDRLLAVVDAAVADSGQIEAEQTSRRHELQEREQTLSGLLSKLDTGATAPAPANP
jgi:GTP-binding protein EngB required for normal cell division